MCIERTTIRYAGRRRKQPKKLSRVVDVSVDSICSGSSFSSFVDFWKRRRTMDRLGYFFMLQSSVGLVCFSRQRHAEDAYGNLLFSSRSVGNIQLGVVKKARSK